jgi:hypothetical protein
VGRVKEWDAEGAPPAELACRLARDRFWRDERRCLGGTHPDWPEAAYFLELPEEVAHAFVLVLSRLPAALRRSFAERFYEQRRPSVRTGGALPARLRPAVAAQIALAVLDLAGDTAFPEERVVDLLHGRAQGDDLTQTPATALEALTIALEHARAQPADGLEPADAVAIAVAEVLAPSSGDVDLKEILAHAALATVEAREPAATLRFLLDVDRLFSAQ